MRDHDSYDTSDMTGRLAELQRITGMLSRSVSPR